MKIDINTKNDLKQAFDLLHDSLVDLGSLSFQGDTLSLLVKREDVDSVNYKIENYIIFKQAKLPLILANLTFYNVSRYKIIEDYGIVIHCLTNFTLKENIMVMNFCEGTKLQIEFKDNVRGLLEDIKSLEEYGASWLLPFWVRKLSKPYK